jgi:hypothetical protein
LRRTMIPKLDGQTSLTYDVFIDAVITLFGGDLLLQDISAFCYCDENEDNILLSTEAEFIEAIHVQTAMGGDGYCFAVHVHIPPIPTPTRSMATRSSHNQRNNET